MLARETEGILSFAAMAMLAVSGALLVACPIWDFGGTGPNVPPRDLFTGIDGNANQHHAATRRQDPCGCPDQTLEVCKNRCVSCICRNLKPDTGVDEAERMCPRECAVDAGR
jgi:hypothetical protein